MITQGKVTTYARRPRECEAGAVEKLSQQLVRGTARTHARARRTSHRLSTASTHQQHRSASSHRPGSHPPHPGLVPNSYTPARTRAGRAAPDPPPPPTRKFRTPLAPLWRAPPSQRPGSQLTGHKDGNRDSVDNKEDKGSVGVDGWWSGTARARARRRVGDARLYSRFRMEQSQPGSGVPRAHPPLAHRPQGGGGAETPALGV